MCVSASLYCVCREPYFTEDACYVFSQPAAAELEEATYELHNMCLEAVEAVLAAVMSSRVT